MKSLSQLRQTLTENTQQLDEISLKTASNAYARRMRRADNNYSDQKTFSKHYQKAQATGRRIEKKFGPEGKKTAEKADQNYIKNLEESNSAWNLPMVLLLRRKTIRNFSDGTKVALYYNDRINRYFTIPVRDVEGADDPIAVSEELTFDTPFDQLQALAEGLTVQSFTFPDGAEVVVDQVTAQRLMETYNGLNEYNQTRFIEGLTIRENLEKFVHFAQR